jgi:hypothetical protein
MKAKKKKIETLKPEDLGLDFVRGLFLSSLLLFPIVAPPLLTRAGTRADTPARDRLCF